MENKKILKGREEECDVLILGAGMAGLTAAIYSTRYNLKTIVVGKKIGGTEKIAGLVENWPGFIGTGEILMNSVIEQVKKTSATIIEGEIKKIEKNKNKFFVEVSGEKIIGRSIIVALGMQHRKLNIQGENEFLGKGVSYCATCDGIFFKEKNVAVVGGADSAAKSAIYLSGLAKKVYVLYRKGEMRCEPAVFDELTKKNNIDILYFSKPAKVIGEKKVTGLEIENLCEENKTSSQKIDVDGVFIEIGAVPMIEIVKPLGIKFDDAEFIITDKKCKTNVNGVFAAGDNANNPFKQLVVSAGEGAIAAKSAYDYLRFELDEKN